jgi:BolA protein
MLAIYTCKQVIVVSNAFEGKSLVQRHRFVNQICKEEIGNPIHALSIHAMTQAEWNKVDSKVGRSPACLGGSKKEKN